jgi:hypothetical protein
MRVNVTAMLSLLLILGVSRAALPADSPPEQAKLTAAQIVEKHVAARGGLQAWRALHSLSVSGKMDAGAGDSVARSMRLAKGGFGASAKREHASTVVGADQNAANQQVQLPFTLALMRPHKSRLQIEFAGKTAVQVYDGTNGWKLRPYLNRSDAEPFTAEETKSEADRADMDGPLIDYQAKGSKIALEGMEPVDGHAAYKIKLTTKSGEVQHIWIDAQSFLDVKVEGLPRRMDGSLHTVWVYQRDFRSVQGLMIPFVLETAVDGYRGTHSMVLDKVEVNPKLSDNLFAKPTGA